MEEFYDKIHNGKNKQVSLNAQAASFVPNKVKLTTKSVSKKKGVVKNEEISKMVLEDNFQKN